MYICVFTYVYIYIHMCKPIIISTVYRHVYSWVWSGQHVWCLKSQCRHVFLLALWQCMADFLQRSYGPRRSAHGGLTTALPWCFCEAMRIFRKPNVIASSPGVQDAVMPLVSTHSPYSSIEVSCKSYAKGRNKKKALEGKLLTCCKLQL